MTDVPRLIEHAFPLKQTSLDSVHEKNVRHGHISTLHIWPARRPLAACRAALIATLLPDPSADTKPADLSDAQWEEEIRRRRQELCEKIGGRVVTRTERKRMPNGQIVERLKEETEGGILHWGRETKNTDTLEWFRQEIRRVNGGRAPKVLDPFAGGGAIPLEAMRLGCEATAIDINPVAWLILKCTLEYPQKFAGQTRPLPDFILEHDEFMREFFVKSKGYGKAETTAAMKRLHDRLEKRGTPSPQDAQGGLPFNPDAVGDDYQADLAWHVRAWGRRVLTRARKELAQFYPTYADFEPLDPGKKAYERQPMRFVPLKTDGTPDIDALNGEFSKGYLADKRNPRWVTKPTVAYLWARTVTCKNCRATMPLLKTRWLCKKSNQRVLLTMAPNADGSGVVFGVQADVPVRGGNPAQRREHDKVVAAGTMSSVGAGCPCCKTISTMQDLRLEGQAGRIGTTLVAVIIDTSSGKRYRLPTVDEFKASCCSEDAVGQAFAKLPGGRLTEKIPANPRRFATPLYGMDTFESVFTSRQRLVLAVLCRETRLTGQEYPHEDETRTWAEAITAYLALVLD